MFAIQPVPLTSMCRTRPLARRLNHGIQTNKKIFHETLIYYSSNFELFAQKVWFQNEWGNRHLCWCGQGQHTSGKIAQVWLLSSKFILTFSQSTMDTQTQIRWKWFRSTLGIWLGGPRTMISSNRFVKMEFRIWSKLKSTKMQVTDSQKGTPWYI